MLMDRKAVESVCACVCVRVLMWSVACGSSDFK